MPSGKSRYGNIVADNVTVKKEFTSNDTNSVFDEIQTNSIDMSSGTPTSHAINMSNMTLPASSNALRGASVNPTRTSGWVSFSGTIGATPEQCYTDYRELHTTGVAEVLGFGCFPFADDGATVASMLGNQTILSFSSGSTLLTRGGDPVKGAHAGWFKIVMDDGSTFDTGGRVAPVWSDLQLNGSAGLGAIGEEAFNFIASTGSRVRAVFRLENAGGTSGWDSFAELDEETSTGPVIAWGADATGPMATPTKGLRFKAGSTEYQIPLYIKS